MTSLSSPSSSGDFVGAGAGMGGDARWMMVTDGSVGAGLPHATAAITTATTRSAAADFTVNFLTEIPLITGPIRDPKTV